MDNPNILSHVSIGTNKFEAASKFYDAIMATIEPRGFLSFQVQLLTAKNTRNSGFRNPLMAERLKLPMEFILALSLTARMRFILFMMQQLPQERPVMENPARVRITANHIMGVLFVILMVTK